LNGGTAADLPTTSSPKEVAPSSVETEKVLKSDTDPEKKKEAST
jgi:hypothetical protein